MAIQKSQILWYLELQSVCKEMSLFLDKFQNLQQEWNDKNFALAQPEKDALNADPPTLAKEIEGRKLTQADMDSLYVDGGYSPAQLVDVEALMTEFAQDLGSFITQTSNTNNSSHAATIRRIKAQ